jgi:flagellar basal body-associated protein FliL
MGISEMTELNETAAIGRKKAGGIRFASWKIMVPMLVAIATFTGGAVYWYSTTRQPAIPAAERIAEPPFYLDLKPFVVSVADSAGIPHFVQLELSLALSGKDAGDAITSVFPEVQDAMRETVLAFRVEDIVTAAGVGRLRKAMIGAANRVLLQRLGASQVKRLAAGSPSDAVVQNIFFPTLIVE